MVYAISDGTEFVKIGITKNILMRMKGIQTGNPNEIKCLIQIFPQGINDIDLERALHMVFDNERQHNRNTKTSEWFHSERILRVLIHSDKYIEKWIYQKTGVFVKVCKDDDAIADVVVKMVFDTVDKTVEGEKPKREERSYTQFSNTNELARAMHMNNSRVLKLAKEANAIIKTTRPFTIDVHKFMDYLEELSKRSGDRDGKTSR